MHNFSLKRLIVAVFYAAIVIYLNLQEDARTRHLQDLYQGWPIYFKYRSLTDTHSPEFNMPRLVLNIFIHFIIVMVILFYKRRKTIAG